MKFVLFIVTMLIGAITSVQAQGQIKDVKFPKEVAQGKKIKKTLDVEFEEVNGEKVEKYTLVIETNGQKEVTIWDGKGEMPPAIKEAMEDSKTGESNTEVEAKKVIKKEFEIIETNDGDTIVKRHTSNPDTKPAKLGLMIGNTAEGLVVMDVIDAGPAEYAGVKPGDILLKIDNEYLMSEFKLNAVLERYKAGSSMHLIVLRDSKEVPLTVKL